MFASTTPVSSMSSSSRAHAAATRETAPRLVSVLLAAMVSVALFAAFRPVQGGETIAAPQPPAEAAPLH